MWLGEDDSAAVDSKACDGILLKFSCMHSALALLQSCSLTVKFVGYPGDRIPLLGFYDATAGER